MTLNSNMIRNAILALKPGYEAICPELIFRTGYSFGENMYFIGRQETYGNLLSFWIAYLSWVNFDLVEFRDLSRETEKEIWLNRLIHCKPAEATEWHGYPELEEYKVVAQAIKNTSLQAFYDMSREFLDQHFLFDYGNCYVVRHWYSAE
jgi:hypothetical protein